ncbi:MAG: hypothetical protein QOK47_308 [Actinomycetota bacterium]|nr:hypothetical protein [Actinomycetota bacterium]
MKVLAVEDDHEFREFLKMHFSVKHPDIELEVAATGEEALVACARTEFQVVVVDSFMPNMGGGELTEKLKALYPSLRIISFSGSEQGITWAHRSVDKGGKLNLDELASAIRKEAQQPG